MQRVNQIIQEKSSATAASFIYLPAPPKLYSPNWNKKSQHYLNFLTELTNDLPPTILVHGVST
uniref:SLC12A transporter C-terminal domain-containing protein n=1 Tax=Megaselia scalaris TaxID=36166 RepID=T1GZ79_MEGSC